VALAVAAAVLAQAAHAAWMPGGSGPGFGRAATMPTGALPTATVSIGVLVRNVTLGWTASTLPGATPVAGYVVHRYDSGGVEEAIAGTCTGVVAALECVDSIPLLGAFSYRIEPAHQLWRGPLGPPAAV
jgi:hypothetical protein